MLRVLATTWLVVGVLGVAVMHRRGHDSFGWALLFAVFGPLAVPLAISSDRNRPPEPHLPSHDGSLDVLVALDQSADHAAAIEGALQLLAGQITSITVATVMDLEAPTTVCGRETQRIAEERLEAFAADLASTTDAPIDTVILYGQPNDTLQRFAAEHGYELVVACNHTTRLPVVGRLTQKPSASVPVLIA